MTRQEKEQNGISIYAPKNIPVIVTDIETGEKTTYPTMAMAAEKIGTKLNTVGMAIRRGSKVKRRYLVEKVQEEPKREDECPEEETKPYKDPQLGYLVNRKTYFDWGNHKPYT